MGTFIDPFLCSLFLVTVHVLSQPSSNPRGKDFSGTDSQTATGNGTLKWEKVLPYMFHRRRISWVPCCWICLILILTCLPNVLTKFIFLLHHPHLQLKRDLRGEIFYFLFPAADRDTVLNLICIPKLTLFSVILVCYCSFNDSNSEELI